MPVTITFRTTGAWGPGQGSNLSPAQVDTNFYNLQQSVVSLESDISGGAVVSIANVTMSDNVMTVTLTDGSSTSFTVPNATWAFRGAWAPFTAYSVGDVVQVGVSLYLVLFAHVSASSFDPGANDGLGHNYYQLILSVQQAAPVQTQTGTSWTPGINDAGTYNRFTNASNVTVTVPNNSTVAFPINTEIHLRQAGTGNLLISGAGGVTVHGVAGYLHQTSAQGATVTMKKVDTNQWDIFGLLAAGSGGGV